MTVKLWARRVWTLELSLVSGKYVSQGGLMLIHLFPPRSGVMSLWIDPVSSQSSIYDSIPFP